MPQLDLLTFQIQILSTLISFFLIFFFNIWIFLPLFWINLFIKFKLYFYFFIQKNYILLKINKLESYNFIKIYMNISKIIILYRYIKEKLYIIEIIYLIKFFKKFTQKYFNNFFKIFVILSKISIFISFNNFYYVNKDKIQQNRCYKINYKYKLHV